MQLFIQVSTGKTFVVSISPSDTIKTLKETIQRKEKISIVNQSLSHEGQVLHNTRKIEECHIADSATILLTLKRANSLHDAIQIKEKRGAFYDKKVQRQEIKEQICTHKRTFFEGIQANIQTRTTDYFLGVQVSSMVLTKKQDILIIGTNKGQVLYYSTISRKVVDRIEKFHGSGDLKLAISCDDKYLAIGASDALIYVYEISTKVNVSIFQDQLGSITCLTFANDCVRLISCSQDNTIRKYHIRNGEETIIKTKSAPKTAVLSKDDRILVFSEFGKDIKLVDLKTQALLKEIPNAHDGPITLIQITSNNRYIISTSADRCIKLFDLEKDIDYIFRNPQDSEVTKMVLTPNEKFLICSSTDRCLMIYDLERFSLIKSFPNYQECVVKALVITNDGKTILSAGDDKTIRTFHLEQENKLEVLSSTELAHVYCMDKIPNSENFAVGCSDNSIKIYDFHNRQSTETIFEENNKPICSMAVSQDGRWLATGNIDFSINIFNLTTKQLYHTFSYAHDDAPQGLAFTKDSKLLVSCGYECTLKVWRFETEHSGPIHTEADVHEAPIECMVMSKDSKYILTASWDKSMKVFELVYEDVAYEEDSMSLINKVELNEIHQFKKAHDAGIRCAAFTSDNKFIVSGGCDNTVRLFDFERRALIWISKNPHKLPIWSVAIVPGDEYIVSAGEGGIVNILSISERQCVHTIPNVDDVSIKKIAVTADSKLIVTISHDGKVAVLNNPFLTTEEKPLVFSSHMPATSIYASQIVANFISEETSGKVKLDLLKNYRDIVIHPQKWNFFHIVAIFYPKRKFISLCVKEKIPFTVDKYNRTPLHYLLYSINKDITLINYLLENFENLVQDRDEMHDIVRSFSHELKDILALDTFQVAHFLKYTFLKPQSFNSKEITRFGSIPNNFKHRYHIADSTTLKPEVEDQLISTKTIDGMMSIKALGFELNYNPISLDMLRLLKGLKDIETEDIFKTPAINLLIKFLWDANKRFHYYWILAYSMVMIVMSVYSILQPYQRDISMEVILLVSGLLFFLYEIYQSRSGFFLYIYDFWNTIDVITDLLIIATMITIWCMGRDDFAATNLLSTALFFGYIRWISYLRAVDQTRRLIRMVTEVLADMVSFFAILTFLTIGFAIIFFQFQLDETDFASQLLSAYSLVYAAFDISDFKGLQIAFFIIFTILISVVLLNLLIAIINDSYARVRQTSDYFECKEKIALILEAIPVRRAYRRLGIVRKLFRWCPRRMNGLHSIRSLTYTPKAMENKKGFLFYVEKTTKDEYLDNVMGEKNSSLDAKLDRVLEQMESQNSQFQELKEDFGRLYRAMNERSRYGDLKMGLSSLEFIKGSTLNTLSQKEVEL